MPASRSRASRSSIGDRLVGAVAAGHHQRDAVRARAGAGDAGACRAASRPARDSAARPPRRPASPACGAAGRSAGAARAAASSSLGRDLAELAGGGEVAHHQRERLLIAVLPTAQLAPRPSASPATQRQVVAAQPLDGTDLAPSQGIDGAGERIDAARRLPSATSRSRSRGPQAGQAVGWAWKRRLPGSSYSARHAGHMANEAMVVRSRS